MRHSLHRFNKLSRPLALSPGPRRLREAVFDRKNLSRNFTLAFSEASRRRDAFRGSVKKTTTYMAHA
jgi:hypothetical protein